MYDVVVKKLYVPYLISWWVLVSTGWCDSIIVTSASVKDWRMSPHGIAGLLGQSSWNLGSVDWPDP